MTAIIVGLLVGVFGLLTLIVIKLATVNAALRCKLQTVEGQLLNHAETIHKQFQDIQLLLKRTTPKELSQEQKEFKETLELKWKTAMEELEEELQKRLKKDTSGLKGMVESFKKDFDKKVKEEYDKAVASIAFHTVEYKKTITKKRREYSRKNKATKPQKNHRTIDDE